MHPATPSSLESAPLLLLSYDVSKAARTAAARVSHLIFGRSDRSADAPVPYIQRPGVVWIGQSVFVMPAPMAEDLADRLRRLGAQVTMARVHMDRGELETFRRRTRRGATAS